MLVDAWEARVEDNLYGPTGSIKPLGGFFEEDFTSWTLVQGPIHFLPSQYGYLSSPPSDWPAARFTKEAYTLYWDLSYILLLQQVPDLFERDDDHDIYDHCFILRCNETGPTNRIGLDTSVPQAFKFHADVLSYENDRFKAGFHRQGDQTWIDNDGPNNLSLAVRDARTRNEGNESSQSIAALTTTLFFPTIKTPLPTIFALHKNLPPSAHNWSEPFTYCDPEDHEEMDEEDETCFLSKHRSIAMSLVVDAGMERESLVRWDGRWTDADYQWQPVMMWGRRRNCGRRVVGFLGAHNRWRWKLKIDETPHFRLNNEVHVLFIARLGDI
ncbi:hypothetical protein HDV00_008790 [Rhizophlyctis rosea]|nr:hypothetical protein HDV00_008790 [Rhizophlyctis rosea]